MEGGKIDVDGMAACVDSFSGIKDCEPPMARQLRLGLGTDWKVGMGFGADWMVGMGMGAPLEGRDGHGSSFGR